ACIAFLRHGVRILVHCFFPGTTDEAVALLATFGGTALTWLAVDFYARKVWRNRRLRLLHNWLKLPPDINGWWRGQYQRYDPSLQGPTLPIKCAFLIQQTLWSTHIMGWGEQANRSESYSVRWLSEKDMHHFKLAWLYRAKRNEAKNDPQGD